MTITEKNIMEQSNIEQNYNFTTLMHLTEINTMDKISFDIRVCRNPYSKRWRRSPTRVTCYKYLILNIGVSCIHKQTTISSN